MEGGHTWQGGMCGKGGGACMMRGTCMVKGGMCGERGVWMAGGHAWQGGHVWYACPPLRDTAGQCAGGTHPTGMHSCNFIRTRRTEAVRESLKKSK